MNLWVDDERPAPEGWVWAKTYSEAIQHLRTGTVLYISLDHDLGRVDALDGYRIACWIEERAVEGSKRIIWSVHSQNPVGARKMVEAMEAADRFWRKNEQENLHANVHVS